MALTFTNKAAAEMNDRIAAGISLQEKRLFVGTFHSFCSEILHNHGSYIGVNSDFENFNSVEDLNGIIDDLKQEYSKCNSAENIEHIKILSVIQYFEKHLCLTEEDMDICMPKTNYDNAFKWFYFQYQEKLKELNALDFDLLILLTYKLFKEYPNVARIYRSIYKYINVDEFQDTNYGQYMLLKALCGSKNKNVFVVADDDQVIYGWNGANYKRLSEFKEEFSANIIQLNQNFRCPAEVIDLANKLITHNSGRTAEKKPLEAMKGMPNDMKYVFVKDLSDFEQEKLSVSNTILKIKEKYPDESICVLARTNRLLENIFEALNVRGISCAKSKRKDEFETPYVLWIHVMLKLANHRTNEKLLVQVITLSNMLTGEEFQSDKIILEANMFDGDLLKSFNRYIEGKIDNDNLKKSIELDLCEGKSFLSFINNAFLWMDELVSSEKQEEYKEQLEVEYSTEKKVWKDIQRNMGYNHNMDEILLSTFLREFSMISKEEEPSQDVVQCLTIHASKGKEFDNVFLIGMVEDELPSFQSIKKGDQSTEMEEERRNCFVAITRTRERLFLTYSKQYFGWKKKVSRFMIEMFQ